MLFFPAVLPDNKFQGGSPVDPLFESLVDPPFDSTSQCFLIVISASLILYRAIHVVIVSQNYFVLFSWGITQLSRYVARWGIAQLCLWETKCNGWGGGVSHHSGGAFASLKRYRAIWGIAAVVSVRAQGLKEVNLAWKLFNLAWKFQSRLKISSPTFGVPHRK